MKLTFSVKNTEHSNPYDVRVDLLKDRLAAALEEAGLTQADLSRAAGVSRATVTSWMNGDTRELKVQNLVLAAQALKVNPLWLSSGKGTKRAGSSSALSIHEDSPPFYPHKSRFQAVPVVSSVAAGEFSFAADPFPVGNGDDELLIDSAVFAIGPRAFALRIKGDSMRDEYLAGEIIVIDPDVTPQPREPVVAKRDEDDEATFKIYVPRGHDDEGYPIIELLPLNPYFPALIINREHPGRIIGPMVTRIQGRRRH